MADTHHPSEESSEKKPLVDQLFDPTIAGGAMFYTILALLMIFLVLIGII